MKELESRKRLLVAESELNRSQLVSDLDALQAGVRALTDRSKSYRSIVSATAMLLMGVAALRRGPAHHPDRPPSWRQTLFKGLGLISSFWLALRTPKRDPDSY